MNEFSEAIRRAIYLLECPMYQIAERANISRSNLYTLMQGRVKARRPTAYALANAVSDEIDAQIERRQREIEELKRKQSGVRRAYMEHYGGGDDGR